MRFIFISYDEPWIRSTFSLVIVHASPYTVTSNMPILNVTEDREGFSVTKFEDVVSTPSTLINFVIAEFMFIEDSTGNLPIRIYARPEAIANNNAALALDVAGKLMSTCEKYFGISLAVPKIDFVALPEVGSSD